MTGPAIPDDVVAYLTRRWEDRDARIAATFAAMNPRERKLFREAAVMGYVQGVRSVPGGHDATIPPDLAIVAGVIGDALSFNDLYPTIARMGRLARRREATTTTEETPE